MTSEAAITLDDDLRVAQIADRLAAVELMEFEVCAGAATFGLGILQRATCRRVNGIGLQFREANRNMHRMLRAREWPILTHFTAP